MLEGIARLFTEYVGIDIGVGKWAWMQSSVARSVDQIFGENKKNGSVKKTQAGFRSTTFAHITIHETKTYARSRVSLSSLRSSLKSGYRGGTSM